MDRNSIVGLLMIGGILLIFSIWNAGNSEPTKKDENKEEKEVVAETQTDSTQINDSTIVMNETPESNLVPVIDSITGEQVIDTLGNALFTDTITGVDTLIAVNNTIQPQEVVMENPTEGLEEEIYTLENDLIQVDFSNLGGDVSAVYLKNFRSYEDYLNEKQSPLQLFDNYSNFGIKFFQGDSEKYSGDFPFTKVSSTENSLVLKMTPVNGKSIIYTYSLAPGEYHVNYSIAFEGFDQGEASNLVFFSNIKLLATEKYLPNEKRVATAFFEYGEHDYDYLSIAGDDEWEFEEGTDWVAFKQSYFAAIVMKDDGFSNDNDAYVEVIDIEDENYVKEYKSELNLDISNIGNTTDLKWYFGPNDYDILATYENGSEDIVDLGWGLFRWINVWFIRPLFNFFLSLGIGAGLAILLLTIVVKLLLSPVNYKMYKSSAMMKVLKPEIEKLAKKFPKKEDAMKKQQATMALYRETGVSPLSGCVPMLIQMPILFAIFRLFPSSLELRQQGLLWAEDLSSFDAIFSWTADVPVLSTIYGNHVSLFTLLMAGTTLLYTHYNSSNMQQPTQEGMPNMKIIMYFFPVLMIFFFNTYSSGLSYYYFISTLMTILIMWAIKKFIIDEEKIKAKIEENRSNPKAGKKKSKFAQRLEEAQRLQQERAKQKKR